jgi:hypothetical protein
VPQQGTVSKYLKQYNESCIGIYYEQFFRDTHGDTRGVKGKAPAGVADCVGSDGRVYQVKHADELRKSVGFNVREAAAAEIKYCEDNRIDHFIFHLCNEEWSDPIKERDIYLNDIPTFLTFTES